MAPKMGVSAGLNVSFHLSNQISLRTGLGYGFKHFNHTQTGLIFGTDFNPSQASFAQELSALDESGAVVYDDSFEEFANRTNLPDFDYIGLHGIWSWVSDENRKIIVGFLKKKLKLGD